MGDADIPNVGSWVRFLVSLRKEGRTRGASLLGWQ